MPYEIRHDGGEDKPYCVYNKVSGKREGCSTTREQAQAHVRALYAAEKKEAMDIITVLKDALTGVIDKLRGLSDKEAEEVAEANTYERSFSQYKQADGTWRWVTVSSTAFIDRDAEIVSKQSLEKAVALGKEDLGYLTYWHEPAIKLGKCDAQFVDGVCLVETGTWFDDEVSEALRKDVAQNPDDYGVSIEFRARVDTAEFDTEVNGVQVKTVWNDIELGDRSLLPAQRASNIFARIEAQGGSAGMKEEKLAFLRRVVGDDLATKVAGTVDRLNEFAQSDDAVTKEAEEIGSGEDQTATEEVKAEDVAEETPPADGEADKAAPADTVVVSESPLNKLRQFAATLDEAKQIEIAPIIIELDKVLSQEEEPEPEDETPADSTGYDPTANDETAKEAEQTEPQATEKEADAQPPVEHEPSPEVTAALAEVDALREQLQTLIDNINASFEEQKRKQQEEVPNIVLARAVQDPTNVITSRSEVQAIKAQTKDDDSAVASMTAAIVKLLGGIQ